MYDYTLCTQYRLIKKTEKKNRNSKNVLRKGVLRRNNEAVVFRSGQKKWVGKKNVKPKKRVATIDLCRRPYAKIGGKSYRRFVKKDIKKCREETCR